MRILSSLLVVTLLATTTIASDNTLIERSRIDRDVEVLLESRAVTRDLTGTFWVYHGINGIERERAAAGVTALRPDGTTRTYLASDILPPGSVMSGMVGQVYAVTPLTTPGSFAATAGWLDPQHRTHNAIVFFSETADGRIVNQSVIKAPGARAIASGPQDTVVVATVDLEGNGDLNLATIVDANGKVLSTYGPFTADSRATASTRIWSVRFHQIDRGAVAILDGEAQRAYGLRIHATSKCATDRIAIAEKREDLRAFGNQTLWSISIADLDLIVTDLSPVLAFTATANGEVTVARSAVIDDAPRTIITRYDKTPRSSISTHVWRAALLDDHAVRGFVAAGTVWEERIVGVTSNR